MMCTKTGRCVRKTWMILVKVILALIFHQLVLTYLVFMSLPPSERPNF